MSHGRLRCKSSYGTFLDVDGRLCLVVGGGSVAHRKVAKLVEERARVRVISPELTHRLHRWADDGRIEWYPRPYQIGDVSTAAPWLVFAATDNRQVNRQVWQESEVVGRPVNVADDPALCSFTLPAVFRRGFLRIAISTSGTRPREAKRLKEVLEADIDAIDTHFQDEIRKF